MKNLRMCDTCATCKHVFYRPHVEDEADLYCTLGAGERPRCGYELEDTEMFALFATELWSKHISQEDSEALRQETLRYKQEKAWDDWRKGRLVAKNLVCDDYERDPSMSDYEQTAQESVG